MRSLARRASPYVAVCLVTAACVVSCGSSEDKKKVDEGAGGDAGGANGATSGSANRAGTGGTTSRAGSGGGGGRGGTTAAAGTAGTGTSLGGAPTEGGTATSSSGDTTLGGDGTVGAGGVSAAPAVCGDAVVGGTEDCDGQNLDGASCTTLHGAEATGTLSCSAGCSFNDSACHYCGDHLKNNTEDCDGTDLAFATCSSKITSGTGTLACGAACTFDYSGCSCLGGQTLCTTPTLACKDTMTDEANCGGCGIACSGSDQCSRGRCVTVLGHNVTSPTGITVDANNVYFLNAVDTFVYSVPKAGGTAPVSITSAATGGTPDQILEVGSTLYWTTTGGLKVMQVANTGGTGTTFVGPESASPTGLATDGTSLWWSLDTGAGSVRTATLASGVASTKVSGAAIVNPKRVAITGSYIVVADAGTSGTNGSIYRTDLNGANQTPLATGLAPTWGLCVDATHAYFTTNLDNKVFSVPLDASAGATTLSSTEAYPWDIVCDGSDLYWANSGNGQVRKMAKTGGAVTTVAQGADLSGVGWYLGLPKHLAVDATYVYWTDQGTQSGGGGVFRVAKN